MMVSLRVVFSLFDKTKTKQRKHAIPQYWITCVCWYIFHTDIYIQTHNYT